jgi:hypothetical protein
LEEKPVTTEPSVTHNETTIAVTAAAANISTDASNESSRCQTITLSLAVDDTDITDHLVVTFAKNGSLECPDMLHENSTSKLLYDIELKGQNITEPSLMAIADANGVARRVFITPCPSPNFRDYAIWVGLVSETVQNLKARSIALYPCHGSLTDENTFELVAQLVRALLDANAADNVALIVGRYNYNKILNLALELKNELKTDTTNIKVVH